MQNKRFSLFVLAMLVFLTPNKGISDESASKNFTIYIGKIDSELILQDIRDKTQITTYHLDNSKDISVFFEAEFPTWNIPTIEEPQPDFHVSLLLVGGTQSHYYSDKKGSHVFFDDFFAKLAAKVVWNWSNSFAISGSLATGFNYFIGDADLIEKTQPVSPEGHWRFDINTWGKSADIKVASVYTYDKSIQIGFGYKRSYADAMHWEENDYVMDDRSSVIFLSFQLKV